MLRPNVRWEHACVVLCNAACHLSNLIRTPVAIQKGCLQTHRMPHLSMFAMLYLDQNDTTAPPREFLYQ